MMRNIEQFIAEFLEENLNIHFSTIQLHAVGGGSINETYRVSVDANKYFFLKLNTTGKYPDFFIKEKNGLDFICQQKILQVPQVVACKTVGNAQLLLLEWIDTGVKHKNFWQSFGEELAMLHRVTDEHFGFYEDNYMGALVQVNSKTKSWTEFFIHHRLRSQLQLAKEKQLLHQKHIDAFERLEEVIKNIFNEEKPSLLHGDLWSGNYICNADSRPVLIDPAVYFGHRSMDLAMTTLFGGFDKHFYDSYHYHFPFPSGYTEQWEVCNLYPLLIHLNLFGAVYLNSVENILKKIC